MLTLAKIKRPIEAAKNILANLGIEDSFTVKVKPLTGRLKNSLGLYRSFTQFRSRPIFWINERLDLMARAEGIRDAGTVRRIVTDTILHEYGHVIWEYARARDLNLYSKAMAIEEDEEDFAERFARFPGDFRHLAEAYMDSLRQPTSGHAIAGAKLPPWLMMRWG